jgi:small subunit ribosomal protein S9
MKEGCFGTVGKRKEAIAQIQMMPGKGEIKINGRTAKEYFPRTVWQALLQEPLEATKTVGLYDVTVYVQGGGLTGQAAAVRLGIARALLAANPDTKGVLRQAGLLTRDSRVKERKKYGRRGARRGFQHSKR